MKKSWTMLCIATVLMVGCGDDKPQQEVSAQATAAPAVAQEPTPVAPQTAPAQVREPSALYSTKCASCHGAKGEGKAPFPKLAGQAQGDLEKKLHGYQDGTYGNEKKGMMIPNAKALSADDISALAHYISTL